MATVTAIGSRAHAALQRSAWRATALVPLSESLFAIADDEIVWLGPRDAMLHGRAVACDGLPTGAAADRIRLTGVELILDARDVTPWRPPPPPRSCAERAALLAGARALAARIADLGEPEGFATAVAGRPLPSALAGAAPYAAALATACAADDADAATRAAVALLGRGPGLTPSGDDFVGGALFARALCGDRATAWRAAARDVVAAARARTHPVSAALLADHADGHGYAPLHDLAAALAAGAADAGLAAARRLTRLGHTTGWDIVAGFLVAMADGTQRATID